MRLYDDAHRALIKRLAGLHVALIQHHDTGGDQSDATLIRLVHANGFPGAKFTTWFLTDTARLAGRRAMLERIIPRLKIADRLSLDDRFLHVRGRLNAYSIHLGAGGAFCGTRHICIVPSGEGPTGKIWLPFEGDRILSLILSKAVLLAADDKITDPVILAQIR